MKNIFLILGFPIIFLLLSSCGKKPDTGSAVLKIAGSLPSVDTPSVNSAPVSVTFTANLTDSNGAALDGSGLEIVWEVQSASDIGFTYHLKQGVDTLPMPGTLIVEIGPDFNYGDINGQDIIVSATAKRGSNIVSSDEIRLHVNQPAAVNEPTAPPDDDDVTPPLYATPLVLKDDAYFRVITKDLTPEMKIAVSDFAGYHEGMIFQVTLLKEDGSVSESDHTAADGFITVKTEGAVQLEVTPVFRFIFGKQTKEFDPSYVNVLASDKYELGSLCGFFGKVEATAGAVHFKGTDTCFVFACPQGSYDLILTKGGEGRSSVRVNDKTLGCNVGIAGGAGRTGSNIYKYFMEDVINEGSTLYLTLGEKDYDIAALEIRRTTKLRPSKTHVYIAGDSTASAYYPIEDEEPANGRAKTGWGQVFLQYLTGETAVTNLGAGGTYAKSWYEIAFNAVVQNGRRGDIFLVMEGINDQSYSNVDEMVEYLSKMVDECREKGIIPVLLTPMQSPKFWRSDKGKDLGEYENPLGGGKAGFMAGIRKLAKDKGVFLIDVADITSKQYGTLGRSFVAQNFHLYYNGKEEDTLHLSYAGAKNIAGIIATELFKLQESGAKDSTGSVISGLTFNDLGSEEYTYTDASGNEAVYSTERITAIYRRYDER
jgi:lysophospholipase L1-like esterase